MLEEGKLTEADEHFHVALRLQPDLPAAHQYLGSLHEVHGELAEAEEAFRTAIRLQPRFPSAQARLALLLRGELPEADVAAIRAYLSDPHLGGGPRARLLFGLAHVLDGRGDYTGACGMPA